MTYRSSDLKIRNRKTGTPPTILGGQLLKLKARNHNELEQELQNGMGFARLETIKNKSQLSDHDMALLLGISPSTYARRKRQKKATLSPNESIRAYRYARILEQASQILGNEEEALVWLNQPVLALGNRTPMQTLRNEIGAEQVLGLLHRLDDGAYS